jgi:hypothetical protein
MIVLWNTIYMEAVLEQFRKEKKVSPANERKLYSSFARISATYGDFERFERESTRSQNGEETRKLTSTELREPGEIRAGFHVHWLTEQKRGILFADP